MNLLMTQQHLQQESAGPGSPAVPLRFQSAPPWVSEAGSWHQRDADFPSLKAPQITRVRVGTHAETVLLKSPRFFCRENSTTPIRNVSILDVQKIHTAQAQVQVHTRDETV